MKSQPIISVSGLRGIIGESLSPDLAADFVNAFCAGLPEGDILIGRDGRASGKMISAAIQARLAGLGRNVIDADVAATPTIGILVRHHGCAGGVQISASHNPSQYNGIKLFNPQGQVLDADAGQFVLDRYRLAEQPDWVTHENIGATLCAADTTTAHLERVLATVDQGAIQKKSFRVLLDSNHGAGSRLGQLLLETLGCQVECLGGTPDGQFAHPPEPTRENLQTVSEAIAGGQYDIAFCQDPDADRLAFIDENGRYPGEEYTLAICLDHVLQQNRGPIVTNCATSRMSADLAAKYGVELHRSSVGEANVVQRMQSVKAVFGGEGNGGPIDPRVGFVRDSFVGMALILDALTADSRKISERVDAIPAYQIVKTKVELERDEVPQALDTLESHFEDAASDRMDGLRLDWDDRWLLIRGSNTEPIVRLIAEASDAEQANSLCNEARVALGK